MKHVKFLISIVLHKDWSKSKSELLNLSVDILLRCSYMCMINYQLCWLYAKFTDFEIDCAQFALLWHCTRHSRNSVWSWILYDCIMLYSLLETMFLIRYSFFFLAKKLYIVDFEIWLRIYATCFYIFFVTSSMKYALLDLEWIRVFSTSKCNELSRLLLVKRFLEDFVIVVFVICAIWIAQTSHERQTLLLEIRRSTSRIEQMWLNRCRLFYYWRKSFFVWFDSSNCWQKNDSLHLNQMIVPSRTSRQLHFMSCTK